MKVDETIMIAVFKNSVYRHGSFVTRVTDALRACVLRNVCVLVR